MPIFEDKKLYFDSDYPSGNHYKYDLSLSENPLGCSSLVKAGFQQKMINEINHYPDKTYFNLRFALSQFLKIPESNFYIGDGASGIVQDLIKIFIDAGQHVLMADTTFPAPMFGATALGGCGRLVPLASDYHIDFNAFYAAFEKGKTGAVFLCNPNNPTGIAEPVQEIIRLAKNIPVPVIVSEANIEFCSQYSLLDCFGDWPQNLVVLRSFSKAYGLAGLRVGYAIASGQIISMLRKHTNLFKVSAISEQAAIVAISDQDHVLQSIDFIFEEKARLQGRLDKMKFECIPSDSNIFVARMPNFIKSHTKFLTELNRREVSVVSCASYSSLGEGWIRIAPRSSNVNNEFLNIVENVLNF